jgi:dTDP-4-dehydrorhamnose reductase
MKRVVVTGASGLLGWNLCRLLPREGFDVSGFYLHHTVEIPGVQTIRVDLRDREAATGAIRDFRPDGVIHTAAISDADFCQTHGAESYSLNVVTPIHLAALCRSKSIPYVFISSDLIFDGRDRPYRESDPPRPLSRYGEQKVLAERGILQAYPEGTICRLPFLIGLPGPGGRGVLPMLEAMREGKPLRLFVDEYRTPLVVRDVVAGLLIALERVRGILHLGGPERISRYNLGRLVAEVFDQGEAVLIPTPQRDVVTAAPRPLDVSLDSSMAFEMGFRPVRLEEQLRGLRSEYRQWLQEKSTEMPA